MSRAEHEAVRSGNTCDAAVTTAKKPVHSGFCWVKQLDCNGHRFIWRGSGKGYNYKLNSGILGEGRSITLEVEERRLAGFLTFFFTFVYVCVHVGMYAHVHVCHEMWARKAEDNWLGCLSFRLHTRMLSSEVISSELVKVTIIVALLVSCSKRIKKEKQIRTEVRN